MAEFLSIKQVAERMAVHPNTVRNAIKWGKLKYDRFGRFYRITEQHVQEYMALSKKISPETHNQTDPMVTPSDEGEN